MAPVVSYEEARKQRVEENNRKMQALGLLDLATSLKADTTKKGLVRKPSQTGRMMQLPGEARRSSRMIGKPAVSYRDQLDLLPGMRMRIGSRDRQPLARRYLSDTARMATIDAAEKVYEDIKNPAFVKAMLRSHTASCFWLGLPANFCKQHMSAQDERYILEDENSGESECLYLAHKVGLSGGWRGFSLDHGLVDGDCCIFELVEPLRFKVYIFRCEEDYEEASVEETVSEKKAGTKVKKTGNKMVPASSPPERVKGKKLSTSLPRKLDLDGDEEKPKVSKKFKREVEKDVAGSLRSSLRKCRKDDVVGASQRDEKVDKSENLKTDSEGEDVIELDSGDDDDEDEDFKMPAAAENRRRTRRDRR